jgi:opacity protein-like surface antigen
MNAKRFTAAALLTTVLVGRSAFAQEAATATPPAALPDPTTDQQTPRPVDERARPFPSPPRSEVGVDIGLVARPALGDGPIHYPAGWGWGGHVRADLFDWLGFRLAARFERSHATFEDGALGLATGTDISQPDLKRIGISLAAEPTWRVLPRFLLYVGVGAGWGRTTAEQMHTTGAETVVLPSRSAVFVEFPLSVGGRFEIVPNLLVVNLSGAVSVLIDQSGRMVETYDTPNQTGLITAVGPFPKQTTSFSLLTGLGILL